MIDDNKKTNSLTNTETTATTNDNTNSEADKLKKNTKVPSKTSKQVQFLAHYSISDLNLVLRRDCPRICRFYNSDPGCKYGAGGSNVPLMIIKKIRCSVITKYFWSMYINTLIKGL